MKRIALLFAGVSLMLAGFTGCPEKEVKKVVDTKCGAENHFYSSDGRLFVTGVFGKSSIFEVTSPSAGQFRLNTLYDAKLEGDNKTLVHLFHGIAEYGGYLFVLCNKSTLDEVCLLRGFDFGNFVEPYLFYARIDEISTDTDGKAVEGLFRQLRINPDSSDNPVSYANGMVIDDDGNVFVADSMGNDAKIVSFKLGELDDEDTSNDIFKYNVLWEEQANGMALDGDSLYFTNVNKTDEKTNEFRVRGLTINMDFEGNVSAENPRTLFRSDKTLDDLSVYESPSDDSDDGLLVTNWSMGYIFYVNFSNDPDVNDKIKDLCCPFAFSYPSSVRTAASPMFKPGDVTVTELGIYGLSNLVGNKLSYMNIGGKLP